jgi:hypothetical protein
MVIPDVDLQGTGYMNNIKVFVKIKNYDITLEPNVTDNSYLVRMKNLYFFIRSQDFKYNMWFVPIKASLDIEVGEVDLNLTI